MKIESIEAINLRFEYPPEKRFRYAGGICDARVTSLVRVHTDTGHVGIGSAYTHPALFHIIVKQQLEPILLGEDPCEVEALWERMYGITRWYGRKGAAMTALGALDMAFWDLRGKALGRSIRDMLGGVRATCPVYASSLLWKDPKELAEEASRHVERGFRRMKMRLGRGRDLDVACVEAVRGAIGTENDLIVDGSMRYSLEEARSTGEFLAKHKVFWFEEPFPPEDLDSFAALRGRTGVRLAAGENEFGVQGFRELIRAKAVDIIQPDACRCGGISETWKAAKLAQEAGLGVATHSWNDAVTIMANAHVVSSVPNGITVEMDQTGNPFIEELLLEPMRVKDGELRLSDAPGLGIALNEAVVKRYRMADPLALPDGLYSDMAFGKGNFKPAASAKPS